MDRITNTKKDSYNIFQDKKYVVLFAVIAMFSWGCAYPFIKMGMKEFHIVNNDFGGKILFAGVRFTCAGIITIIISKIRGNSIAVKKWNYFWWLILFGFINTGLHYFCFYIGLSNCVGSKSSIIDALGTFWLIILACIIFHEKMTLRKVIGCILGFSGIVISNIGMDFSDKFSFSGEGMLIASTFCAAFGGIITRIVTKKVNAFTATGYSLLSGGIMLWIVGLLSGGKLTNFTVKGAFVLLGLVVISVVGFVLYNQLLSYNPVGEIAIFNSLIPVFGTLMSCVLLGEKFYIKYVFSMLIIAMGIYIINRTSDT